MSPWTHVDRLIDGAIGVSDLRAHGIDLLAARRWRELGMAIPPDLEGSERAAVAAVLAARVLLARIRAVLPGPILLIKGPEVAALYPDPALRPYGDIDVLVPNAADAWSALLAAGFERIGHDDDFDEAYHRPPLRWPGLPLLVEVHGSVWWPAWASPPGTDELLAVAAPGMCGVEGILGLPRPHHAVVLATHSWLHLPLRRLLDLVDVAAMAEGQDRAVIDALAREWGVGRVWSTTRNAIDTLIFAGPNRCLPARTWARHLAPPRRQMVVERVLAHGLGRFWAQPASAALSELASAVHRGIVPPPDESWPTHVARKVRTARRAFQPADAEQTPGIVAAPPGVTPGRCGRTETEPACLRPLCRPE